jgi:hypothetical protein
MRVITSRDQNWFLEISPITDRNQTASLKTIERQSGTPQQEIAAYLTMPGTNEPIEKGSLTVIFRDEKVQIVTGAK